MPPLPPERPADGSRPRVSVVIPTTGRPTLLAAVRSALEQTEPVERVIVAVDGPAELGAHLPPDARLEVVSAGAYGSGGNAARVAGLACIRSGLVALLDDDDVWHARKVEVQVNRYLAARQTSDRYLVVACRVREVRPDGTILGIVPRRIISPGQSVAGYLFERRSVLRPGGMLNSSMLLFDRELASEVPFDTTLARHQDWDWLLRVDALSAARFEMVPDVLVDYAVSPTGASTSSAQGWQNSEAWVGRHAGQLSDKQRAEILLSVTMPIAIKHGDWTQAARLMLKALLLGPDLRSLAFGAAHVPLLLSRRASLRMAGWSRLRRLGGTPPEQ